MYVAGSRADQLLRTRRALKLNKQSEQLRRQYKVVRSKVEDDIQTAKASILAKIAIQERDNIKKHGFISSVTPSERSDITILKRHLKSLEHYLHY